MVELFSRPGLSIAVAVFVVAGSLGLVGGLFASGTVVHVSANAAAVGESSAGPSSKEASSSSESGLAHALSVEEGLRAKGVSTSTVHLPNFAGEVTDIAQPIQPSYVQAPAPMGVADIGLENRSGVLVPYALNTTTVAGTVNITNLQSVYVDGDGPDTFGIQENSVLNGVTIFGNSSYEFWCQNYIGYTVSTHNLTFGDEVWNFSTLSGYFPTSSIYGFANGTYSDFPFLYQGFGPSFTIDYPFTLTLYLNASLIDDRPAIYFNYTLSNATFRHSASFDDLIFNSTVGTPKVAAPTPYYQADGYNYDPIGLINDMEIDILGNDDGDTTAFLAADATLSLEFWNASAGTLQEVPSAFSAGQETGETCVGLLVYSSGGSNPIGIVRTGPGLVGGLWNYSSTSGAVADTVTVHPIADYSFLFVNIGSAENVSASEWVPTSTTGTTTFYLPTGGTYFLDFLMSEHDPADQVVTATTSTTLPAVHLTADAAVGIYTPLFAFDNAELAAISSAGAGTEANPYVLLNNQYGSLAPQFAGWDDYLFPLFPGLLLDGTSAWATVTPPSFEINLPSWDFSAPYVQALNLPLTNDLQIQFYDASNISLVQATGISGWLSSYEYGFPESEVIAWNCTNLLIASNTFDDEGNALLLYGGTANTVWGNSFEATTVAGNEGSVDAGGPWITGVNETESGDLVYNNLFEVGIPAITPTVDPFPCDQYDVCVSLTYSDTWNVSDEPSSDYAVVHGFNLTGSIIGTPYQGGSYWSNYGMTGNPFGVLPYNNSGAISAGGDYVPLVPYSLYALTFDETGLAAGLTWNVSEGTVLLSTNSTSIAIESPNGTFAVSVVAPTGYAVTAAPSDFTVDGAPVTVYLQFAPLVDLAVQGVGLPADVALVWSATVNGTGTGNTSMTVTNSSYPSPVILFELPSGSYNVSAAAQGYTVSPTYMTVSVAAPKTTASFTFTPTPGSLLIMVSPATASVLVNGVSVTLTGGQATTSVPAGIASIEVTASGYLPYYNNVTVTSGATTTVPVILHAVSSSTSSSGTAGISDTGWALIALLAVLAVIFLIGMVYFARRPRQGAGSGGTAPAQPWKEPPPEQPPPSQ
jgi:thermopsin